MTNLTSTFGKYISKELQNPDRLTCDIDPVLQDIENAAAQNKLSVQIREPGKFYDTMMRYNRLQIHVDRNDDGNLKIRHFQIG